jgi:hypothetical protein
MTARMYINNILGIKWLYLLKALIKVPFVYIQADLKLISNIIKSEYEERTVGSKYE